MFFFKKKSMDCKLTLICISKGRFKNKRWEFKFPPHTTIAVGRIDGCHLIIDESTISLSHCLIYCKDYKLYIIDLGSKYGTIVNHEKASEPILLPRKSLIELGQITLQASAKCPNFDD